MTDFKVVEAGRALPVAVGRAGEKTGAELLRLAHNLACQLPASPVAGEVAVLCVDRYYFAAAVLGVWLAGHTVALPPNDKLALLRSIQQARPLLAVLGDGQESAQIDVRSCVESRVDAPSCAAFSGVKVAARVYSSGTTQSPVAHDKTFAQLFGEAEVLGGLLGLNGSTVLPTVPAQHIYGFLAGVLAPLTCGATFVRETPLYATQILEVLAAVKADVLVSVPAHLKGLAARAAEGPLGELSLGRIVSSGAPLPNETGDTLKRQLGVQVIELFGSTETGGIAQRLSPGTGQWAPLPGVQLTTAAALGRAELIEDQLLVQSAFTGFEGWFVTADRVELLKTGTFLHKNRSDRVGKVGGRRVDLGALEHLLAAVPGVEEVAVLGLKAPPPRDLELVAVLVAPGVTVESLRTALLQVLDPVAVPRRWRFVRQIPRQAHGKLARLELEALFDNTHEAALGLACETRTGVASPERNAHTFSIFVPRQAWFFQGHFEGDPLMPAVVQLNDLVLPHSVRAFGALGALRQAQRLKFKRPIRPGELLTLELKRPPAGSVVHFELLVGERTCSSGTLLFGEVQA